MEGKYRRIPKPESEKGKDNEIRVTSNSSLSSCLRYILGLFDEGKFHEVVLLGMGKAIANVVTVAEILRRRIAGLYMVTVLDSPKVMDSYEPLEPGLNPISRERNVSRIRIHLSKDQLNKSEPGYQAPLPAEQLEPERPVPRARVGPAEEVPKGADRLPVRKVEMPPEDMDARAADDQRPRGGRGFRGGRGGGGFRGRGRGGFRGGFRGGRGRGGGFRQRDEM